MGIQSAPNAVCLLCSFLMIILVFSGAEIDDKPQPVQIHYAMVIDAGSTGSRAFVFQYLDDNEKGSRVVKSIKGKRATPGLSTFAQNLDGVMDYFEPLFLNAIKTIPPAYHNETLVYIKGTAGMRLLRPEDQNAIWDSLVRGLADHPEIPFIIQKENFGTIDGRMEAYYAVLSSNYIAGGIDGNLRLTGSPMVGALDMGGSSTQLIFHTSTKPNQAVQEQDFWSHSWLNYGVEKVRERVWMHLVTVYKNLSISTPHTPSTSTPPEQTISNPCAFADHRVSIDGNTLVGTGDRVGCQKIILDTIFPSCFPPNTSIPHTSTPTLSTPCYVNNIIHPSIQYRKFYGMSVYFYAFDCIRHLSGTPLPTWPTPTIAELERAVTSFCSNSWADAVSNMLPQKEKGHKWTLDAQLPHRCIEATYLLTLLEYGYGFNREGRDVTLALEVEGYEVEWTLGFALSEVCLQCLHSHYEVVEGSSTPHTPHTSTPHTSSTSHTNSTPHTLTGITHTQSLIKALLEVWGRVWGWVKVWILRRR